MSALEILALVVAALKGAADIGPIVIKTATSAKPFIMQFVSGLLGRPLTADEQATIEAQIDALHTQFQVPLPPPDDQDI